jgi:hypothetical protein
MDHIARRSLSKPDDAQRPIDAGGELPRSSMDSEMPCEPPVKHDSPPNSLLMYAPAPRGESLKPILFWMIVAATACVAAAMVVGLYPHTFRG